MGVQQIFLFLVFLCAAVITHGQPANVGPRYKQFLRQHVKGDMTAKKCDGVIGNLKLTEPNGRNCKSKNTFILANSNQVRAICTRGGRPRGNGLFESNNPFPVVICKHTGVEYHNKCRYRGSTSTRKVVIACDQGWPVHYGDDIVLVN
ncbi:hypothetical protein UPYG_G00052100 [Umbra pygmaea]|uniref:Ribonuclease A-domain domain-containing protein n=1 Tax=Umbra pygmaea TaxID=75934 RepID=A0ABD0XPE8_UMBPY